MKHSIENQPVRIEPYVLCDDLGAKVPIARGPFRLTGNTEGSLTADLIFRWQPTTEIEFEGDYDQPRPDIGYSDWTIESTGDVPFKARALITNVIHGSGSSNAVVRGIIGEPLSSGQGPFNRLRFCLANFPDYVGEPVKYELGGKSGLVASRLRTSTEHGECLVDKIGEASSLVSRAHRESGHVISHVGEWTPACGSVTVDDAKEVVSMLHVWFGFLRVWIGLRADEGADGRGKWAGGPMLN